jgi:catechol 2,3-dioxygenase-like lactoylglutathione lyase family enzyme
VGIPVTDQDRALDFYVGTLGFDKRMDVPIGGDKRWIVVGAPHGTATLALEAASAQHPAGVETGIRLISHDVDNDHAALRASRVDVGDILRWPGVPPMFALRDQDGNGLEIVGEATA